MLSLFTNGATSFAGGTFLYTLCNDPTGSLLIYHISSEGSSVRTSGATTLQLVVPCSLCTEISSISESVFRKAFVSCSGLKCQLQEEFLHSQVHTVSTRSFENLLCVRVDVNVSDAKVHCLGTSCSAVGGAGFVGVSSAWTFHGISEH